MAGEGVAAPRRPPRLRRAKAAGEGTARLLLRAALRRRGAVQRGWAGREECRPPLARAVRPAVGEQLRPHPRVLPAQGRRDRRPGPDRRRGVALPAGGADAEGWPDVAALHPVRQAQPAQAARARRVQGNHRPALLRRPFRSRPNPCHRLPLPAQPRGIRAPLPLDRAQARGLGYRPASGPPDGGILRLDPQLRGARLLGSGARPLSRAVPLARAQASRAAQEPLPRPRAAALPSRVAAPHRPQVSQTAPARARGAARHAADGALARELGRGRRRRARGGPRHVPRHPRPRRRPLRRVRAGRAREGARRPPRDPRAEAADRGRAGAARRARSARSRPPPSAGRPLRRPRLLAGGAHRGAGGGGGGCQGAARQDRRRPRASRRGGAPAPRPRRDGGGGSGGEPILVHLGGAGGGCRGARGIERMWELRNSAHTARVFGL